MNMVVRIPSESDDYDESQLDFDQNNEKENNEAYQLEASLECSLKNSYI
jgi:hypothetical protein